MAVGALLVGCALVSDSDHLERLDSLDQDGDGVVASEDCDDSDAAAFPGNVEACDNVDNDCDGEVDEDSFLYMDLDGDGFGNPETGESVGCEESGGFVANAEDCNDSDPLAWSGAVEICNDGSDNDCDGTANECVFPPALTVSELDVSFQAGPLDRGFGERVVWVHPSEDEAYAGILIAAPAGELEVPQGSAPQGAVSYFSGESLSSGTQVVDSPTLRLVDSSQERPDSQGYLGAGLWSGFGDYDITLGGQSEAFSLVTQPVDSEFAEDGGHLCRAYLLPSASWVSAEDMEIRSTSKKRVAVSPCGLFGDYGSAMSGLVFEQGEEEFWSAIGVPGYINNAKESNQGAVHLMNWKSQPVLSEGGGDPDLLLVEQTGESEAFLGRSLATVASSSGDLLALGRLDGFYWLDQGDLALVFEQLQPSGSSVATLPQSAGFVHSEGSDASFGSSLVALDIDGDGNEELAVGAPGERTSDSGEVFVFGPLSAVFSAESAGQVLTGDEAGEQFGAVLSSGDLNGDGYADLAVGAPQSNFGRGGVLLYSGNIAGELETWVELAGESGAFGSALDASGDWEQDGVDDLLIGAPGAGSVEQSGSVYLLKGIGL